MSLIEKLDGVLAAIDALKIEAREGGDARAYLRMANSVERACYEHLRDHGPAIRQAMIDAEQLAAVRIHLPTKVETTIMAGMDAEEMAAFDSGYNAALDRAHLLLMASAAPANEALEPDSLGFGARTDAANNRAAGEGEGHD